MADFGRKSTTE